MAIYPQTSSELESPLDGRVTCNIFCITCATKGRFETCKEWCLTSKFKPSSVPLEAPNNQPTSGRKINLRSTYDQNTFLISQQSDSHLDCKRSWISPIIMKRAIAFTAMTLRRISYITISLIVESHQRNKRFLVPRSIGQMKRGSHFVEIFSPN